ncbi:MAG: hypothetical protein KDK70_35595 [Myxococcales bacterium]|nr:hypothetical protein [Myxococcales bacterium]
MSWYTPDPVYDTILAVALLMPPATLLASRFISAPYGRFGERFPLPKLHARWGWMLMELPATLVFWPAFLSGPRAGWTVPSIIAGIWAFHYLNRGFVFPSLLRVPRGSRTFSVMVVTTGMVVTTLHGYLHGYFVSRYGDHLTDAWLTDGRFLLGIALYVAGMALNLHSDAVLRALRTPQEVERGDKVYRIPRRGGFLLVTSPQYLGELTAWVGFALVTWSLAGVFILAISAANLVPRAIATHRWYRDRFPDYPAGRKILVPFVF